MQTVMKKKYESNVFYYTHFIESFIADTYHLSALEKYAYLTMIWEAHRKRGVVSEKSLDSLLRKNKDIPKEAYYVVINEFWQEADGDLINSKITSDMQVTNLHKEKSQKGANTTNLQKMINSDKRQDEYNQIHDAYPSKRRVARKEGLALYCKQLQNDKRMTFETIMHVVKSFDCQPQFYPMLDTLLRDTQGKYWKAAADKGTVDNGYTRVTAENELYKLNKDFYKLPVIERGKLINEYLKTKGTK